GRHHLDILGTGGWLRWREPLFTHLFQVELDRLTDKLQHLIAAFASGDAPGQIRNVRPVAGWPLLDNNGVAHKSVLQSGLFQYTVHGAFWNVNTLLTRDGDKARLH